MADNIGKSGSLTYSFPKLKGPENYRTWKNDMESCLTIYRVWDSCMEVEPQKPEPKANMTKQKFLALEGKTQDD